MTALPPSGLPSKITELAGFEVIAKIGQGGMGAVYKARQGTLDRLVALKVLPPRLAKDEVFIQRFLREARASAKLNHPHIIQGIDVGQDKGLYYFAMEFVEGRSLRDLLRERGALEEQRVLQIMRQVASALDCAHQAGLVHRDVKPDNILLAADGAAKLADLGLAKQVGEDSSLTQSGMAVGTPHYVSPEQARGQKDVDGRSDLYSLGATWFHLVTGRLPYEGDSAAVIMVKHLNDPVPKANRVNPQVSEGVSRLIERLMRKKREQRIQTAAALVEQIDLLLSGKAILPTDRQEAVETGRRGPPPLQRIQARTPTPSKGWLYGVCGLAILLVLGVLLFAKSGGTPPPVNKRTASPAPEVAPAGDGKKIAPPALERAQAPAAAAEAWALLRGAEAWEREHPEAYAEQEKRYAQVRECAAGTAQEKELASALQPALERISERKRVAAEKCWSEAEGRVKSALDAEDFDSALKELAEIPEPHAAALAERRKARIEGLRKEAEQRTGLALAAAEKSLQESDPAQGLKALAAVEKLVYAPTAERLKDLRARLEEAGKKSGALRQQQALEDRLNGLLTRFEAAIWEHRDWSAGRRIAEEAAQAKDLEPLRSQVAALGTVTAAQEALQELERAAFRDLEGKQVELEWRGQKLQGKAGKVSGDSLQLQLKNANLAIPLAELTEEQRQGLRGAWQPATAAQKAVLALEALGKAGGGKTGVKTEEGKALLAKAAKLLGETGDFPLAERWLKEVRRRQLGAGELAAEEAWKPLEAFFKGVSTWGEPAGNRLSGLLQAFEKDHGATEFGKGKAAALAQLKEKAEEAIVGFNLGKIFKGKVEHFSKESGEIVLFYDFENPSQGDDWELNEKSAVLNGRLTRKAPRPCDLGARHKAVFSGNLEIAFETLADLAKGGCNVTYNQQDPYWAQAGSNLTECYLVMRGSSKKSPHPAEERRVYQYKFCLKETPSIWIDDKLVISEAPQYGGYRAIRTDQRIAFSTGNYAPEGIGFDHIRIRGTLQKAWLDERLQPLDQSAAPPSAPAGPRTRWTNGSGDGRWSTAANWSLKRVPQADDHVLFDQTSTSDCLATPGSVAQNLKSLTTAPSYKGTLTFEPEFAAGNRQELTLNGDLNLLGGTMAVTGLVRGEGEKATGIGVTFNAANITIGKKATLHSDERGFPVHSGPGCGNTTASGGAHGGDSSVHGRLLGRTHGSAEEPLSLGSGGGGDPATGPAKGGGAIRLNAKGGRITIDGQVRCNGGSNKNNHGGGAGGSLYLICETFAGGPDGLLQAVGGRSGKFGGGGGRIAVRFKTNSFSGKISAAGGTGENKSGENGSVVLKPH